MRNVRAYMKCFIYILFLLVTLWHCRFLRSNMEQFASILNNACTTVHTHMHVCMYTHCTTPTHYHPPPPPHMAHTNTIKHTEHVYTVYIYHHVKQDMTYRLSFHIRYSNIATHGKCS